MEESAISFICNQNYNGNGLIGKDYDQKFTGLNIAWVGTILDGIFWIAIIRVRIFWVGIFQVGVILGGNFPGENFPGGSYPGWEFSLVWVFRVGVVQGESSWWEFSGWEFS